MIVPPFRLVFAFAVGSLFNRELFYIRRGYDGFEQREKREKSDEGAALSKVINRSTGKRVIGDLCKHLMRENANKCLQEQQHRDLTTK